MAGRGSRTSERSSSFLAWDFSSSTPSIRTGSGQGVAFWRGSWQAFVDERPAASGSPVGATYRVPAQSLVAVGIGVIYLSLYAAHAFYALVGAPVAFVAMALVTAVGFTTALRLDSRALAVLATLGGLLTRSSSTLTTTPPSASSRTSAFSIWVCSSLRPDEGWPGLALLAFAGTQFLYWSWLDRWYQTARLPVALGWATAFYLAFAAWALAGPDERRSGAVRLGRALVILAAPALYFAAARRVLDDPSGRRLALWRSRSRGPTSWRRGWQPAARVAARYRAALPRARPRLPGVGARGDPWAARPGDRVVRGGTGAPARRLRSRRAGAPRGWFGPQRARVGTVVRRAGRGCGAGGDVPPRAPCAAGHPRGRGDRCPRRPRLPGHERDATPRSWERLARPALLLVSVGSAALLLTVELGQFRTLAIPPPYVPVVKSVVWMLATMMLLALARGDQRASCSASPRRCSSRSWGRPSAGRIGGPVSQPSLRPAIANPRFLAGCLLVVLAWLYGQVTSALPYLGERTAPPPRGGGLARRGPPPPLEPERRGRAGTTARDTLRSREAPQRGPFRAVGAVRVHRHGLGTLEGPATLLRIGAILLFSVTVMKVLVVDLAGLDALYRILSVLVLGAALLVASFLHARSRRHGEALGPAGRRPGAAARPRGSGASGPIVG